MQLGFIGLGHLGAAIAGRLKACGHTLNVWNRTSDKAEKMQMEAVASPAVLADHADIIFMCLFDSNAVRSVLTGEEGLLSRDMSGKIIVDLTTNHFKDVAGFHECCDKAGVVYLESPVLGSVVPASKGALTVLVSGRETGFRQVKPVLEDIGKHVFFLAERTLATKMKLINNLALGGFMAILAEALAFGEDNGLEKKTILDILSVGGGDSLVLNAKKTKLLEEDFSTHFSNALIYKDLHCLQDLAYQQKKSLFTASVIKELFGKTFEKGIDGEDFSAVYKLFRGEEKI